MDAPGNLDNLWHYLPGSDIHWLLAVYQSLSVLLAAAVVWFILRNILAVTEKRLARYEFIKINGTVFTFFRKAAFYLLLMAAGTIIIRILDIRVAEKIFHAVMIIALSLPVKDIAIVLLSYLETRVADKTETRIDDILFELLNRFSGAIIYATAIILALDVMGINVMPFVAGAGVAGVAIGFAAKDTLSNLIAGVLLIIDRPFEVGDRIEVWSAPKNSATWGDVVDIGLRATRIRTTDNIVIIIPNNEIMTRDIVNYTAINEKIRVRINIGVAYDTDIAHAKELIVAVAGELPWAAKDPAPVVVVRNFGESSVDLQLRVWINNARKRIHTISHVTDRVKEMFDRDGIEIPFPRRDITVVERISPQEGDRKDSAAKAP